jgi:Ufm1-specific protease 1
MLLTFGLDSDENVASVRDRLTFYHYACDGDDDVGWGCGYRTLQSLCSWITGVNDTSRSMSIPTIRRIQQILVQLDDKPASFVDSRQWIGTCESAMVLSQLYDVKTKTENEIDVNRTSTCPMDTHCFLVKVDCKLVHVSRGCELRRYMSMFAEHFRDFGSPVMMGGDVDAASKCIVAVRSNAQLLILVNVDSDVVPLTCKTHRCAIALLCF